MAPFSINIVCACPVNIPYLLRKLGAVQGNHVFWHRVERTGSAARNSYQRKRCLTTAGKTFSSNFSSTLSLSSVFFLHFPVEVLQSSGGVTYCIWTAEFGKKEKNKKQKNGNLRLACFCCIWGCVHRDPASLSHISFNSVFLNIFSVSFYLTMNNLCVFNTP